MVTPESTRQAEAALRRSLESPFPYHNVCTAPCEKPNADTSTLSDEVLNVFKDRVDMTGQRTSQGRGTMGHICVQHCNFCS